MPRFLNALVLSLAMTAPAHAEDMRPVLSLEKFVDDKVAHTVMLYASDIDPNSRATDDRYRLTVDGQAVDLPKALLARLDHERRGYSYDAFTDGIQHDQRRSLCMMAGPAIGTVLSVRYLTYDDHRIVADQMRPVLSRPDNCLFTPLVRPVSEDARAEATGAMASLLILLDLYLN